MFPLDALTIEEASEKTGYNAEYLRRLAHAGKIDATKVGGKVWLIPSVSLVAYMTKMRHEQLSDGRVGPRS